MNENAQHNAGNILFVDDEPNVLDGLKRMLRPERSNYTASYASSGQEALELLENNHFDVIVADMRMPKMNGLELLSEVKKRYPASIRIIFSGEIDLEMRIRSVNISHQYLTKPCDPATLKNTLSRTCGVSRLLSSDTIKGTLARIDTLPSLPSIYLEIIEEVNSRDGSIKKIGEIITRDVAMTSKILQLVNSAYFSLPRHISSPEHAVVLLGIETIKALVLATKIFNRFEASDIPDSFLKRLWNHNALTSKMAKAVAGKEKQGQITIDHSFIAGLLHDSGKLILACGFPEEYRKIINKKDDQETPLWHMEKEAFGISHAEAGAYLMGLWGLPFPVIEAIAYHHSPVLHDENGFSPLTSVYIANILSHDSEDKSRDITLSGLDSSYLAEMKLNQDPRYWAEIKENIVNGVN